MKRIAAGGLLVIVSSSVALLALEGLLQMMPSIQLRSMGLPGGYYMFDADAGFDIAPNFSTTTDRFPDGAYSVWSNELGCFDMPYDGESPYILLLGDSFAWGFARFEAKWGSVLEKTLGERVLKCGVAAYGTRQEIIKGSRLISVLGRSPRVVVLGYFHNDVEDDTKFPNKFGYNGMLIDNTGFADGLSVEDIVALLPVYAEHWDRFCMAEEPEYPLLAASQCFLSKHSIVYSFAADAFRAIASWRVFRNDSGEWGNDERITEEAILEHFTRIRAFATALEGQGSALVVILIPSEHALDTDAYARARAEFDREGIRYLDLVPHFREARGSGTNLFWPRDKHWNEEGNKLAGRLVAEYLSAYFSAEESGSSP